jgi:hypothetical protein
LEARSLEPLKTPPPSRHGALHGGSSFYRVHYGVTDASDTLVSGTKITARDRATTVLSTTQSNPKV